jgi:moderate conductance mechanosensitive channel
MPHMLRRVRRLPLLFAFLAALFTTVSAAAQAPAPALTAAEPDRAAVAKQIEDLVGTLENEARRKEMVDRLKLMLEAQKQTKDAPPSVAGLGAQVLAFLSERVSGASEDIGAFGRAFRGLPMALRSIEAQLEDPGRRAYLLDLGLSIALVLAVGFAALWAASFFLHRARNGIEHRAPHRRLAMLGLLLIRTVIDLVPVAAFAAASYGMMSVIDPPRIPKLVLLTVINASLLVQLVRLTARMLLSPGTTHLRLIPFGDETAHYAFIWVMRIAVIGIYGFFIASAARLLGLNLQAQEALLKLVGLVVASLLVILVLQNRSAIAGWLRRDDPNEDSERLTLQARFRGLRVVRRRLADVWHILAILYIAAAYAIWALEIRGGFVFMIRASLLTLAIAVGAALLLGGARRLIRRGFAVPPGLRYQFPHLEERVNSYVPILYRVVAAVVWLTAILGILNAWGADSFAWMQTPAGRAVLGRAAAILLVLVIAVMLWEISSSIIERYLTATGRDGNKVQRSARVRTLLPLIRNFVAILLITLVSLIVLSEIGVDTAPLLAGAGVVGLAIGFGAQTLVKDVITGLFILIEDTIAIGDIVNVAGKGGQVEAMSVRSIRLRDYDGSVHTIPFSEVTTVLNQTKGFSYYVFDVGIAYDEDTDRVMQVLRDLSAELRADREFGPLILDNIDIAGVDKFGDFAVMIKARIKTLPIKQWAVGREFNRRMKKRFDELGIEIPFPSRTVYLAGSKEAVPGETPQIAAAAG